MFLTQQEQLSEIDGKLQLVLEQLAVMNQNRFGRKTEQMPVPEQLAFTDVDGELVLFNEAEVLAALDEREKETTVKKRPVKEKGKREEDLSGIPVVKVEHYLTEKELEDVEYLLEEIPQHMEDTDLSFCEELLPWSTNLPEKCRKPEKK